MDESGKDSNPGVAKRKGQNSCRITYHQPPKARAGLPLLFPFIIMSILTTKLIATEVPLFFGLENNDRSLQIYSGLSRHCGDEISNASIS